MIAILEGSSNNFITSASQTGEESRTLLITDKALKQLSKEPLPKIPAGPEYVLYLPLQYDYRFRTTRKTEEEVILDVEDVETESLMQMKRCPICETAMDSYLIDETRKLHVCGNNPACKGYIVEQGTFKIKGYDGPIIECDKCGSDMQLKSGRFGKYFGCSNEECKNTRKLLKNGEAAPPKEDPVHLPELECEKSEAYFVLRDGASGIFLAANTFPKSRETRAPKVEELKRFRDRISEKFYYLADAPAKDPDGNPSVVRYSRKNKEQYVMSEVDGKATGWTAHYQNGKWVEESKKKAPAKKKAAAKK